MTLARKIAYLRRTETYPVPARQVEAIETHISWVFLVGEHVYKLKKPVRYSYLDFRTLDARHHDCLEEVRLNRRLAGDVYLGAVPLTEGADGSLLVNGKGFVVDWLVHMKRLPAERMLDTLICAGGLHPEALRTVAELLATFYRGLAPVEITAAEYRQRFADDIAENRRELTDPFFSLQAKQAEAVCDAQKTFLQTHAALLEQRASEGRIIEGHGDLRPEHVCLTEQPVVIDCLEFNRGFRILDAVDELAYLAMECERLGAAWVRGELLSSYSRITGDHPPPELVHFHASFRAALRAKIAVWHNLDDGAPDAGRWIRRAQAYLALAESHALLF
jgi:aminoglycoside phosphotransferase family enzyme